FDRLAADDPGELLQRHLAVAVHQHDERPAAVVMEDERLDHDMLVHAERVCRQPRAAAILVTVGVLSKRHVTFAQQPDGGRRGCGHVGASRDRYWPHASYLSGECMPTELDYPSDLNADVTLPNEKIVHIRALHRCENAPVRELFAR